jgi:ATP-dependent helicase/nuclease subunit A
VPAEATPTLRLAPSRPQDVMLGTVPESASPLARNPLAQRPLAERDAAGNRFRRGQLVHTLLQHLPHLPEADREAAAAGWLRRQDADPHIAAEVMAVLRAPDLAPLFGPASRAETPLTGVVGGQVIGGLVDRLAVLPERVLLADYKTNRDAPADAESTPVLYLRQMAAYRAVLRLIYPDRPVTAILIWTRAVSGRVGAHVLPDALLERYAPA